MVLRIIGIEFIKILFGALILFTIIVGNRELSNYFLKPKVKIEDLEVVSEKVAYYYVSSDSYEKAYYTTDISEVEEIKDFYEGKINGTNKSSLIESKSKTIDINQKVLVLKDSLSPLIAKIYVNEEIGYTHIITLHDELPK